MAIRLRFTTPAGHGQTNIDCGSVHGGRSRLYYPGEAGFRGTAYNFVVKGFHAAIEVMNLVLIPPMWLAVLAFGIITLPFQALRLVLSPTTFSVVMYWMFTVPVATPIIWLLGFPVHILNLLDAVIVYVWGPKPPALWTNQQ